MRSDCNKRVSASAGWYRKQEGTIGVEYTTHMAYTAHYNMGEKFVILTIPTVGYGHRHYESVVRFINIMHNLAKIRKLHIVCLRRMNVRSE